MEREEEECKEAFLLAGCPFFVRHLASSSCVSSSLSSLQRPAPGVFEGLTLSFVCMGRNSNSKLACCSSLAANVA